MRIYRTAADVLERPGQAFEYIQTLREEIRALRHELNYAYQGMSTLPEGHPSRKVYERTARLEPLV